MLPLASLLNVFLGFPDSTLFYPLLPHFVPNPGFWPENFNCPGHNVDLKHIPRPRNTVFTSVWSPFLSSPSGLQPSSRGRSYAIVGWTFTKPTSRMRDLAKLVFLLRGPTEGKFTVGPVARPRRHSPRYHEPRRACAHSSADFDFFPKRLSKFHIPPSDKGFHIRCSIFFSAKHQGHADHSSKPPLCCPRRGHFCKPLPSQQFWAEPRPPSL